MNVWKAMFFSLTFICFIVAIGETDKVWRLLTAILGGITLFFFNLKIGKKM